ncbi:uncharacterized protein LOC122504018 [Leptopilina heterotoma]|uniref:uncharacterized protein LOC122504018 n=1 Tax=Leptopilina heterotoma TaxID=63436 RepID=UPI001CA81A95|nr:uncharacterized protein LOC122504018 [Leptopilina heterotoma]
MKFFYFVLPIFFLAVNSVSSQQNTTEDEVKDAKNQLITFVDCYKKGINDEINHIPRNTAKAQADIRVKVESMRNSMYDIYFSNDQKSNEELKLGLKNIITNKTECFNELVAFETTSWPIMENTRSCLLSKLNEVEEYIQNVTVQARALLTEYNEFKTKAEDCTKHPGCKYDEQLACIDDVRKKSMDFLLSKLNKGHLKIIHIDDVIYEISSKLPECRTQELIDFENSQIVKDMQNCINEQNK